VSPKTGHVFKVELFSGILERKAPVVSRIFRTFSESSFSGHGSCLTCHRRGRRGWRGNGQGLGGGVKNYVKNGETACRRGLVGYNNGETAALKKH